MGSWLSLSQAVAGVYSSPTRRRDAVAIPALGHLSLPIISMLGHGHSVFTGPESPVPTMRGQQGRISTCHPRVRLRSEDMGFISNFSHCPLFTAGRCSDYYTHKCKSRPKLQRVRLNNPTQSAELRKVNMVEAYFLDQYMQK